MSKKETDITRELAAIKALASELVQRTSRLEEERSPVQGKAPRKGQKPDIVQAAIDKRNKHILR